MDSPLKEKQVKELFEIIKNSSIWKYLMIRYCYEGTSKDTVEAFSFEKNKWLLSQTMISENATFGNINCIMTTNNKKVLKTTFNTDEEAIESFMEIFKVGSAVSLELFPLLEENPLFKWQTQ